MKITNKHGLPTAIYNAIVNDPYTKGEADYSCTELIKPPYMMRILDEHWDDIEVDAMDRVFALWGQAVHTILERAAGKDIIAEQRFFCQLNGCTISGQVDVHEPEKRLIQDYKTTSVFQVKKGRPKLDWIQQCNILAHLSRENGIVIEQLQAIPLLKDWSKNKARREHDCPNFPIIAIDIPLWAPDTAVSFALARVHLHDQSKKDGVGGTMVCTKAEKWQRGEAWAVMKKGQKRAKKLCSSEDEANSYLDTVDNKHFIEYRPGERVRCLDYCDASSHCPDYQKYLEGS